MSQGNRDTPETEDCQAGTDSRDRQDSAVLRARLAHLVHKERKEMLAKPERTDWE